MIEREGERLSFEGRSASVGDVTALVERYDRWTGRAFLHVEGPGWRVPLGPGYGPLRARLREWFPDVPYASDWMDGRFPAMPAGLPGDLAFALAILLSAGLATLVAWQIGWVGGLAVAGLSAWPLGRLRDAWVVRAEGVRAGPPWAPVVPWYEIEEIVVVEVGRRAWLWTRGPGGGQAASVPRALLPALRARVRRLGGLDLMPGHENLDDRYWRWRAPAIGIPWGIGLGAAAMAWFTPIPWTILCAGALAMAGTGLLGLLVVFRSEGWGFGGVIMATVLYGLVLLCLSLGAGGWFGAS